MEVFRYIYYLVLVALATIGSHIVDKDPRVSKVLRVLAFISPIVLVYLTGIRLDLISAPFLLLAIVCSIAISLHTEGYLRILFGKVSPLQSIVDLTLLFIILFFTTQRVGEFIIFWIIVELMGSLLVILERGIRNFGVAIKYLIVCVSAGDISLFTLLAIIAVKIGFGNAIVLEFSRLPSLGIELDPFLTFLILIGFTAKLGQIPLHFWLPDTYTETPSPGTAIFSALMSKMAVFAILRIYQFFHVDTMTYIAMLLVQGILTAIYGALTATMHSDLKRIMSYSSMGHYGVMTIILSLIPLNPDLFTKLVLLYALYHGFVKAQIFTNIATIELLTNTRDIYRIGYLGIMVPRIYGSSIVAFLSLIGVPPTLGFYAKVLLLVSIFALLPAYPVIALAGLISVGLFSVFSLVYSMKYLSVYTSSYKSKPRRTPATITGLQVWSEIALAASTIAITPLAIASGINSFIDPIIIGFYVLGVASLVLAFTLKTRVVGKEARIWLGGVEV